MESISERRLLLEYTAGRDCLPNGVRPKDILSRVVNDARIGFVNKREFCNKLLTKAVFHGNYDIVELLLIEAKDIVDVNHKADEDDVEMAETNTTYVGWTPLHLAANIVNRQITAQDKVTLCIDIIILLWKNGANPLTSCRIEGRDVSPADIKSDRSVVALLLRILMEVMAASLAAANLLNPVDDDHILLLGWACKCKHTEVAIRLIARVDDPNSILVKETCVLYWMGKETDLTNLDILDALYRKYPNLTQHVNSRTPNKDDDITYGYTPISLACKVNNDKFFQWVLRCFNNTLTVIDLYNTGLTGELPRRLFEFANLKVLNVSKNKLEGISEVNDCVAFECRELEKVVFSDNKFTFVTLKEFFLLPKLKELNFSENAIEALNLDGIEIHQIPIVKLNLSGNSIKDIPHQLFCLPHLEELNLDDNKIAELPEKMWISPRLYQLSVNNNLLTELPVSTGKDSVVDDDELFHSFDSTTSTYVSAKSQSHNSHFSQSYRETMMAPGEMIEIEEVDTRVQQGHGLHLTKLQLNKNKLKVIPPNLSCLAPHLQILLVADNKLNVTPCIRNLPQLLKRLDLSRNELTKFLEKTSAHNETHFPKICPISGHENCIHSSHNKLANLEYLNMSHNNIDNDVNTRHDVFLYYELLQLDLSNNQLKKFPDFALHQSSLLTLDISNNPGITVIPCELSKLEYLCSFKCDGISDPVVRVLNTLKIAEKLAYLRSRMIRVERNNSVKLMIVGMHGKGKTTLLDHLRADGNFQDSLFSNLRKIPTENTSDSVDVKIGKWSYCKYRNNPTDQYPEIQFYTWDCAGEEEYYSTHQWFLHSRTLYLVVWNMSDGDNGVYGLLPWLQGIHGDHSWYSFGLDITI
ncbi:leucine-rich repeat serine/threonine-protein kinase 1-like isoform X2 [Dysidea avara]|uniref:leucine-rich repeat serine/threonine-protein kinase 1-like isoform X2 n=1 Tax=Dysidea avara TaxID=196820 RepID=UPI003323F212